LYPTKLSFTFEGEIKTFHDEQKPKEFKTTKPALKKVLKGPLHTEEEDKCNHESIGSGFNSLIKRHQLTC
jgi:hypothetical protein